MRKRTIILLICLGLAACGVKPGSVEPPEGEQTGFPHTYPDTATDPAPEDKSVQTY